MLHSDRASAGGSRHSQNLYRLCRVQGRSSPRSSVWGSVGLSVRKGLCQLLVGSGGSSEAKARNDPGGIDGSKQSEALVASLSITPADVGAAGQPPMPPMLRVLDGHRRAIQRLVRVGKGTFVPPGGAHQVQGESLGGMLVGAHNKPIELRTVRQGRESVAQVSLGVAVEVPLASESRPTGEDGQGDDLARGEGGFGAGSSFWRMVLAEVVHHDVECSEEGVQVEYEEWVPFLSGSAF